MTQVKHNSNVKKADEVVIVVGYPPIESKKGTPLLSQNRQFQFFNSPTYIYPMVPAYAASNLQHKGYKVYWMDGIAERKKYDEWIDDLASTNADYLLVETKSPVVKTHWKQIRDIKSKIPHLKLIWVGDHITADPVETMLNSNVDYLLTGGDYDFLVVNLLNHIHKGDKLEGGVYWRSNDKSISEEPKQKIDLKQSKGINSSDIQETGTIYTSGPTWMRHTLDDLPFVDRDLTRWELYAYENGNYKYHPATYHYSGRDCWWNRCTFCVWDHTLNPIGSYRSFSPERLFAETKHVVDKYGVKEIFDDAGTLFIGPKLKKFCDLLINEGYNKKVRYGCNMRFNALNQDYYNMMGKAGFRFILYGMESGNQKTLDKLDKGTKEEDTINGSRMADKAGLDPHATIMLGYPWEELEDAKRTIEVAKYCFKKGYFRTMQATVVIPYPHTPLWKECKEKNWLLTEDYDDFDMRRPVMKVPFEEEKLLELTQDLYSAFASPQFIMQTVLRMRSTHDFMYNFYQAKKLLGHLLDFDPSQKVDFKSPEFYVTAAKKLGSHAFRAKTKVDSEKDKVKLEDSAVNKT